MESVRRVGQYYFGQQNPFEASLPLPMALDPMARWILSPSSENDPSLLNHGQKSVLTPGTPAPLVIGLSGRNVRVRANDDNDGTILVGDGNFTIGLSIPPGGNVLVKVQSSIVYLDGENATDGVSWIVEAFGAELPFAPTNPHAT